MTQIIHLLGKQGSGKTQLGMLIAAGLFNSQQFCALVQHEELEFLRGRTPMLDAYLLADYILLESYSRNVAPIESGDWIIDLDTDYAGKDRLLMSKVEPGKKGCGPTIPVYLRLPYESKPSMVEIDLSRLCEVERSDT